MPMFQPNRWSGFLTLSWLDTYNMYTIIYYPRGAQGKPPVVEPRIRRQSDFSMQAWELRY